MVLFICKHFSVQIFMIKMAFFLIFFVMISLHSARANDDTLLITEKLESKPRLVLRCREDAKQDDPCWYFNGVENVNVFFRAPWDETSFNLSFADYKSYKNFVYGGGWEKMRKKLSENEYENGIYSCTRNPKSSLYYAHNVESLLRKRLPDLRENQFNKLIKEIEIRENFLKSNKIDIGENMDQIKYEMSALINEYRLVNFSNSVSFYIQEKINNGFFGNNIGRVLRVNGGGDILNSMQKSQVGSDGVEAKNHLEIYVYLITRCTNKYFYELSIHIKNKDIFFGRKMAQSSYYLTRDNHVLDDQEVWREMIADYLKSYIGSLSNSLKNLRVD